MFNLTPDRDVQADKFTIKVKGRRVLLLILHKSEMRTGSASVPISSWSGARVQAAV